LGSQEFPECANELINRWTLIVDTYGAAGDHAVRGAEDVDAEALTTSSELLSEATDQVKDLTDLLPSLYKGC
jgi:hypothetical protein